MFLPVLIFMLRTTQKIADWDVVTHNSTLTPHVCIVNGGDTHIENAATLNFYASFNTHCNSGIKIHSGQIWMVVFLSHRHTFHWDKLVSPHSSASESGHFRFFTLNLSPRLPTPFLSVSHVPAVIYNYKSINRIYKESSL